eukprot:1046735-Pelagomonas_calceolata.AAC.1
MALKKKHWWRCLESMAMLPGIKLTLTLNCNQACVLKLFGGHSVSVLSSCLDLCCRSWHPV